MSTLLDVAVSLSNWRKAKGYPLSKFKKRHFIKSHMTDETPFFTLLFT
jgi:hypothetical protein